MTLIERNQPSHWYLRDGTPFHEIAKKDGSGNRAYCPRCRDQFVECAAQCPHGVALKPFPKGK